MSVSKPSEDAALVALHSELVRRDLTRTCITYMYSDIGDAVIVPEGYDHENKLHQKLVRWGITIGTRAAALEVVRMADEDD